MDAGLKTYRQVAARDERERLILDHLDDVRHILGRVAARLPASVDRQNLESAGVLGLVEAAGQFDPSRGVDFGAFAQSVASEGGPDPEVLTRWYSDVLPLDADVLTASVVGISGYFADRGSLPPLPGLPRLRTVQRRQLKVSLPWAARRVGIEPPNWLESVAE